MNVEPNIFLVFEKKTSSFTRTTKLVFTMMQKSLYKNYT